MFGLRDITVSPPTFLNVNVSDTQPGTVDVSTVNCHVTAETRASAVTIPLDSSYAIEDQINNLRSILIFDGPNENSTCLGTAYQLWNSNRQFVSTGKTLTIIQLQPLDHYSISILIIQDFENTKEIGEYRGVGSLGDRPIVMDASKHASAFSTYSHSGSIPDCLVNITGTGTLDVYYGGITESKSNLIASYSYNSSNPPSLNTVVSGVGNDMEVIYSSPYSNSKKGGFYIDFTATKVEKSAAKSLGFIVICTILWIGLF
ncbi:unnamed protein product [Caenorhabditis nigoni]